MFFTASGSLPPGPVRATVFVIALIVVAALALGLVSVIHFVADKISRRSKKELLPKERKGCVAIIGKLLFYGTVLGVLIILAVKVWDVGYNPNPILDPPLATPSAHAR